MKKFIKYLKITLYRIFIDPCYGCVRKGNCELYNKRGFCGDWGICWWEKDPNTTEK